MSFNTFILNPELDRIVIFEIDLPEAQTFWINHEPGMWKFDFVNYNVNTTFNFQNGSFCYGSFQNSGTGPTGLNAIIKNIGSFKAGGNNYTEYSSIANLRGNEQGFFVDKTNHIIYVIFEDLKSPYITANKKIGVISGYSNKDIYLNNILYQSRIKSLPNLDMNADDLYFGIRKYTNGTVRLINNDGEFDNFITNDVFGQECRVKLGGSTLNSTDYKNMYTGYITDFNTSPETFTISLGDKKDKIGRSLPVTFYNTTNYPDIKTTNAGKPIPLIWGTVKNVPVICTNESEAPTPTNYKFVLADITKHSIKSLDAVYVNGNAISTPSLTNDTSDNIAYFNITSASGDYTPGDKVTADVKGFDDSSVRDGSGTLIDGALDIVEDIFDDYLNIGYNSDNFDTTQWAAEKTNQYTQGIFINKKTRISEIIEKIAVGHLALFISDGDGKWYFKRIDDTGANQLEIDRDEEFGNPKRTDRGRVYLTSATILYNRNWDDNDHAEYTDNLEEGSIFNTYGVYRDKDFETYIVDSTDAQDLASDIMNEYGSIRPEYSVVTDIQAANLKLFDNISVQIDRQNSTWLGYQKCRVTGITYDLDNFKINLKCRYISDTSKVEDVYPVGYWTSTAPAFSTTLGGTTITSWQSTWSISQKNYALTNFGFWTNSTGGVGSDTQYQAQKWGT